MISFHYTAVVYSIFPPLPKALRCLPFVFCLSALPVYCRAQESPPPGAIAIFHTEIPPHLLATQFNFSAGTGRIARSDKALLSASGEVKGMYSLTGSIYLSTGAGFSYLHSQARPPNAAPGFNRDAWLGYFPSGIGFAIGDDQATIITGIDVLPGFYFYDAPTEGKRRVFTYGLGPEFGFLFRLGRSYQKGLLVGMVGKVQFMQMPDRDDGSALRYTYGGIGMVVRFY